jgi:hypothetical protein
MNINLIYEGKNYNFDIPNNVTIDYIKELSSKIFNSEKELLDLIYNNKKITENGDDILIRDLIPEGESNAILTVQINHDKKIKKKEEKMLPLAHLKQKENDDDKKFMNMKKNIMDIDNNNKERKINKKIEKKNLNKKEIDILKNLYNNNFNNNSKIRLILPNNKNIYNHKTNNMKEKFNNIYMQKNSELLGLIRQFTDKIKKIYLILFNKYKLSNKNLSNSVSTISIKTLRNDRINIDSMDNSFYELAIYEKKIMNYLEIQIQYYKSLLEILHNYDNNNIEFNKLTEFYHKLFIYIPEDSFSVKKNDNNIKKNIDRNRNLINSNSSINLTTLNTNNNKLPSIKIKNYKSPMTKELIFNNKINGNVNLNKINMLMPNKIKEIKESKLYKSINSNKNNNNIIEDDENISSNNNTNKNNILDNISEKNSIYDIGEINTNRNNISIIKPKKKELQNKNEIENNEVNTPIKEIKINTRKSSMKTNNPKAKYPTDKKVLIDIDTNINANKKEKKVKDINTSSMTINDSKFNMGKKFLNKNMKNSEYNFDYQF